MQKNTVKTNKQAVKPVLALTFPEYKGKKFQVSYATKITFSDTNWGGGSKNTYKAVKRTEGQVIVGKFTPAAPWNNLIEGQTFPIPEDVIVVEHTVFCGRDLGITFHMHPIWAGNNLLADPS